MTAEPKVGSVLGLRKGTRIHTGPDFDDYPSTIPQEPWGGVVPEDNWLVLVTGGPVCADNWEWWDTSRKAVDPNGGTGWAAIRTPCMSPVPPTIITPPPPESVSTLITVEAVWATDQHDLTTHDFVRGQTAFLYALLRNGGTAPVMIDVSWTTLNPDGQPVPELSHAGWTLELLPGDLPANLADIVPQGAAGGLHTFTVTATDLRTGRTAARSGDFMVQGRDPKQPIEVAQYKPGHPTYRLGSWTASGECEPDWIPFNRDYRITVDLGRIQDPERYRLWSTDEAVLNGVTAKPIYGYDLLSSSPNICLGLGPVDAAGGIDKLIEHLFLWIDDGPSR